ncbi:MAG TPA: hypothetical protein VFV88_11910 [Steroidobacteraceae bacterium]|jgi:hypothetical protein|nr:hypothetical protein [Steroidobacteraceae bacterium]
MRKVIWCAAAGLAVVGAALAQVEASSSIYFLDVDPARYGGPAGQRIAVQLDDQPRHVSLSAEDEICVQLRRAPSDSSAISAHVRVLRPQPHEAAVVKVAGPGVSPGTYRSTPWGLLLRVVPDKNANTDSIKAVGLADKPVCSLL